MWIRLETGWQRDPFLVTCDGATRHVLNTIWCIAAEKGRATFGPDGEPLHAVLPLEFLEPSYIAREAAFDVATAIKAIEQLRSPIASTAWSPEVPPRIVIDLEGGTATVRSVGKYQAKVLKDRARKRGAHRTVSAEPPRNSAEPRRDETKRNDNETKQLPPKPPVGGEPEKFAEFWKSYPRRVGRQAALRCFSKLSSADQADAVSAAKNYAKACVGREPNFVKHGSSFLSARDEPWREFVEGVPREASVSARSPPLPRCARCPQPAMPGGQLCITHKFSQEATG